MRHTSLPPNLNDVQVTLRERGIDPHVRLEMGGARNSEFDQVVHDDSGDIRNGNPIRKDQEWRAMRNTVKTSSVPATAELGGGSVRVRAITSDAGERCSEAGLIDGKGEGEEIWDGMVVAPSSFTRFPYHRRKEDSAGVEMDELDDVEDEVDMRYLGQWNGGQI